MRARRATQLQVQSAAAAATEHQLQAATPPPPEAHSTGVRAPSSDAEPRQPPRVRKRRFQLVDAPTSEAQLRTTTIGAAGAAAATEEAIEANQTRPTCALAADAVVPVAAAAASSGTGGRPKRTRWSSEPAAAPEIAALPPAPTIDASTAMVVATPAAGHSAGEASPSPAAVVLLGDGLVPCGEVARPSRFQKATFDAAELNATHDTHLPANFNLHSACAGMTMHQADSALTQIRVEAIQRQLHLLAAGRPLEEIDPLPLDPLTGRSMRARSPSPDPTYDAEGRRTNTRLARLKERLAKLQRSIVDQALLRNPEYRPPAGWRRSAGGRIRYERKIVVPLDLYPEYNFKGVLIGARGATQKELERSTGCRIGVRGKGSWSDNRPEAMRKHYEDDHEPQYVWIQADTEEKLARGVAEVTKRLVPMSDEERQKSLRALAEQNGWVAEPRACRVCGALTHLMKECPDRQAGPSVGGGGSFGRPGARAHHVSCQLCGDRSHPTLDCPTVRGLPRHEILARVDRLRATGGGRTADERTEAEYEAFMDEILGAGSSTYTRATAGGGARVPDGDQLALMPPTTLREERLLQLKQQQSEKESCRIYTGADATITAAATAAAAAATTAWSSWNNFPQWPSQPAAVFAPPPASALYEPIVYTPHLWATSAAVDARASAPGLW